MKVILSWLGFLLDNSNRKQRLRNCRPLLLALIIFACNFFCESALTTEQARADEPAATGRSAALPYYNRANRYLAQGRYDDALRDLLEAVKLYPDEPDFHTNLGIAYRKLDRYSDAEREFKIAIAYNRDDWMNWSNLANAYLKQDMLEKTVATFEETLKHKPPAAEQVAIKKDIADIKKVLAIQHGAVPPGVTSSAPAATIIRKGAAATQKQKVKQTAASSSPGKGAHADGTFSSAKVKDADAASKAQNRDGDWGYDAK